MISRAVPWCEYPTRINIFYFQLIWSCLVRFCTLMSIALIVWGLSYLIHYFLPLAFLFVNEWQNIKHNIEKKSKYWNHANQYTTLRECTEWREICPENENERKSLTTNGHDVGEPKINLVRTCLAKEAMISHSFGDFFYILFFSFSFLLPFNYGKCYPHQPESWTQNVDATVFLGLIFCLSRYGYSNSIFPLKSNAYPSS